MNPFSSSWVKILRGTLCPAQRGSGCLMGMWFTGNRIPAHHILCRETIPYGSNGTHPASRLPPPPTQTEGWPPRQPDWTLHKDCCGEGHVTSGATGVCRFLQKLLRKTISQTADTHAHAYQACCWPPCLKCGETAHLRVKHGRDRHGREREGGDLGTPLEPRIQLFLVPITPYVFLITQANKLSFLFVIV